MLLFGLALIVIMILRPRGLVSTREPTIESALAPRGTANPAVMGG